MIAEILDPFIKEALSRKIDYQISKIENGVAKELYNSVGDTIYNMYRNMTLVSGLNDRVKLPFIEFVLSSPVGENLPNEQFMEVAKEYMERMGYGNSCYTVIKNDDKDHRHIHILATTIDINGLWISDSYSKGKSGRIMRELELKHGLEVMEKGKSSCNKTLGESQYRKYFFDTALHKALRSHNAQERISRLLEKSDTFINLGMDMGKTYTNTEWKFMLGEDSYNEIFETLSKSKFFNPLYKDELLSIMDHLYKGCKNVKEFRDKLNEEGYYTRLVSNKGKSYYVYGVPDRSFYIKDTVLPERYRYGKIAFVGQKMTIDEQKHYLYNQIFATLNASSDYEYFKDQLAERDIKLTEHMNVKGVHGISFEIMNIDSPIAFKGSDVSRRLTYQNIQDYYQNGKDQKQSQVKGQERGRMIEPVVVCYTNNKKEWERDTNYMYPAIMLSNMFDGAPEKKRKSEDDLPNNKKKKKRKGLSL